MNDLTIIAEFVFVANKSFVSGDSKPITIPARHYQTLKQNGLIIESARANIAFRDDSIIDGAIRVGLRAGGKYYQITLPKSRIKTGIDQIQIGSRLFVRVLKTPQEWLIEIK